MRYLTRSDWGARAPKSVPTHFSTVNYVFIHHTTGVTLGADQSNNWVRNIQSYHMDTNGWADIAYSFLFDSYGNVFEGRGWGVIGAHTLNYNSQGHGFAYLGDGSQPLTVDALDAVRWLVAESDRRYGAKTIRGHREVFGTECPGDWLEAHLGDLRGGSVVQPAPGPVILPSPVPTGDDYYSVEVMVTQLPVLRRGAKGQYVKNMQGLMVANGCILTIDGDFGPTTERELGAWQGRAQIGSDSICGPATWRRLLDI
jgi:N-acetylmuramoyl-L-alanine amidase